MGAHIALALKYAGIISVILSRVLFFKCIYEALSRRNHSSLGVLHLAAAQNSALADLARKIRRGIRVARLVVASLVLHRVRNVLIRGST